MPVNEIVGAREEVTFRSGAVLTATMLEAAIGAQAAFLSLAYAGYGDGILAGMELADVGGALFLEPGILHAGGGFFLCHERVDLTAFIEARDGEWSPRPDNKLILRPEEVENVKHITRTVLKSSTWPPAKTCTTERCFSSRSTARTSRQGSHI